MLIGSAALAAAGTIALAAPAAASATTVHPHVSATLSQSVIHRGAHATLSGTVTPAVPGRGVYLQELWSGRWHTLGSHRLSSTSRYAFSIGSQVRGIHTYRVYRPAQPGRSSAISRTVSLRVQTWGSITLRSYSGRGDWQGPTVHVPTADYRLTYHYSCSDDFPFLSVEWSDANFDFYEDLWSEPANGYSSSGTWYGHEGAHTGYFDVGSQSDCAWSFQVSYPGWR